MPSRQFSPKGPVGNGRFRNSNKRWRRSVEAVMRRQPSRATRQLPAMGAMAAQRVSSMTTESTRFIELTIRSGSFSTLEVVPDEYSSGEPTIQAAQHDK